MERRQPSPSRYGIAFLLASDTLFGEAFLADDGTGNLADLFYHRIQKAQRDYVLLERPPRQSDSNIWSLPPPVRLAFHFN